MALRIFDTDPDARPAERATQEYVSDFAFFLRTGRASADGKSGVSLPKWRALASQPATAAALVELFGGTVKELETAKDENLDIMMDTTSLEIVLSGADAIEDKLIMWGSAGPSHECDGEFSLMEDDKGEPCGCPPLLADKIKKHKLGKGPGPSINIQFRLAGAGYDLGTAKWIATAWGFAKTLYRVQAALDGITGEALCRLDKVPFEFENTAGELITGVKAELTVIGSYSDAIAEPR